MPASSVSCNNLRGAVQTWYQQITVPSELICLALLKQKVRQNKD